MAVVRNELNRPAINHLLTSPAGPVVRDLIRRAEIIEELAKRRTKGRLRSSIKHRLAPAPTQGLNAIGVHVGSDRPEAYWVEKGTGIYGPHGTPIVPRTQALLRFTGKRDGKFVVAAQVAGQKAQHYLRDAVWEARGR